MLRACLLSSGLACVSCRRHIRSADAEAAAASCATFQPPRQVWPLAGQIGSR
jgi:hypothetical protein